MPLTLLDGDHNLRAGSATVTVPSCTTGVDGLGNPTVSCADQTYPVNGGKVDGSSYTPYFYGLRFTWSTNHYGPDLPLADGAMPEPSSGSRKAKGPR